MSQCDKPCPTASSTATGSRCRGTSSPHLGDGGPVQPPDAENRMSGGVGASAGYSRRGHPIKEGRVGLAAAGVFAGSPGIAVAVVFFPLVGGFEKRFGFTSQALLFLA